MMTRPHTHKQRRRSRKQRRARTRTRTRTRRTKRGGTRTHVARIISNLRNSPTLRNSPHIFSATSVPFFHEFGEKIKQKTDDPIEMISAADAAFSSAHTAMKNKELHDRAHDRAHAHAHDRDRNRIHLPSEFTPQRPQRILDTMERVQIMSKTPGISTALDFPPPPSLNDEKTRSVVSSPTFRRSLAPTVTGDDSDVIRKLNYDEHDDY